VSARIIQKYAYIFEKICFLSKSDESRFTNVLFHGVSSTPALHTINIGEHQSAIINWINNTKYFDTAGQKKSSAMFNIAV
jgi:hypothetical protein